MDDDCCSSTCTAEPPKSAASCYGAPAAKFQIKNTATKDKLSLQWSKGDSFAYSDLGTPNVSGGTRYTLCVYDNTAAVPSLKAALNVASSTTQWTGEDPKGFKYLDKDAASDGVTKGQIKPGDSGKTKIKLSAGGTNLTIPTPAGSLFFDQNPNVVVQLLSSTGKCWTSSFAPADNLKNDPGLFNAQTK